jgi:hypothetical protein
MNNSLKILIKTAFLILLLVSIYALFTYLIKTLNIELSKEALEYIKVLIWPAVVIIIIFLFKLNLAHLIENISEWDNPFLGKGKTRAPIQEQNSSNVNDQVTETKGEDFEKILDSKEKEIKAIKDNQNQLIEQLTRAQIELEFERIYNLIFASQIDLLLKLNQYPEVEWSFIIDHFSKIKLSSLHMFDQWEAPQYIQFLINNQLVEIKLTNQTSQITVKGKAFLSYLTTMNYKKYGI